jgi:DNA-directed RNA polymerase subunit E'/Rpb7
MEIQQKKKPGKTQTIYGVYSPSVLTTKVILSINQVGKNVKQNLERTIQKKCEGKCIPEGFIKPGSINVLTYSSGNIINANIEFQTVYECMLCHPVEGMLMECVTKTITKAGVHAEVLDEDGNVPVTVFIARDHHFTNKEFSNIKEGQRVIVSIIGSKYELNDKYIYTIANLTRSKF